MNGGYDHRGAEEFTRAAGRLVDDRLELRQDDSKVFNGLLRKFDAVHDEQDTLGITAHQKAANERGAEQRFAGSGGHFEEEFAETFGIEEPGNLVHRSNLIAPQREVVLEVTEILGCDNFAFEGTGRLKVL